MKVLDYSYSGEGVVNSFAFYIRGLSSYDTANPPYMYWNSLYEQSDHLKFAVVSSNDQFNSKRAISKYFSIFNLESMNPKYNLGAYSGTFESSPSTIPTVICGFSLPDEYAQAGVLNLNACITIKYYVQFFDPHDLWEDES